MRTENTVTVVALGQHYIIGCISITKTIRMVLPNTWK